ncbi:MAG TPA: DUF6790 family protein [Syntrophales bacterium]|nr:DUF6790 family protein [Syntrophales bacterium]
MAHVIATLRIIVGTIGLFFGYYKLFDNDLEAALDIISVTVVGTVGLLSFVGHLIFHKGDAERLGWESSTPYYQYEVGFAHLAFALAALVTFFGDWGFTAQVLAILGYALYLLQVGILYTWRCFSEHRVFSRYFLRHAISTLIYVGLMIYFITRAMALTHLTLF